MSAKVSQSISICRKKVAIDKIATDLINEVAADVIAKKRKQTKGRAPVDDPEVQTLANEIRAKIAAKAGDEQVRERSNLCY